MAKLYIFAIGGTGARVLRSFTMMMAAGVRLDADEIVPVIIDPDHANADLTRTVRLMDKYIEICRKPTLESTNPSQFFRHEFRKDLNNYTLHIQNTNNKTFKQFISLSSMDKANQAMARMLFSDKNLNSSMEVGFKGNPNIGSVVLNQIIGTDDFTDFANSFAEGDKIFIISSIFGGTGASGFPLLLKTLRTGTSFPNYNVINDAQIGAVTVLPYFTLKVDEKSEINSSTFISKTKSALAYYENNIISRGNGSRGVDTLYYLADDATNSYENHEGGADQQNDAHLIEFLAATAIIDFVNKSSDTDYRNTVHKEFGLKDGVDAVSFLSFYNEDKELLFEPLTQFMIMANCLLSEYGYISSNDFNANRVQFSGIYNTSFMSSLREFCQSYKEWLDEMKRNKRSLNLFNTACGKKFFQIVTDVDVKQGVIDRLFKGKDDSVVYGKLNGSIGECKSKSKEDKFLEMFYRATRKIFQEKFNKA